MSALLILIYILIFIIFALVAFAVMQIKLAGLNVKDFWSFIEANQDLDKLDRIARRYENMSQQEQIIFLKQAERMFDAFDKVPQILWEEEFPKYNKVLDTYKDVKIMRWSQDNEIQRPKRQEIIIPANIENKHKLEKSKKITNTMFSTSITEKENNKKKVVAKKE